MAEPVCRVVSLKVSEAGAQETARVIPEEMAIALVYDGSTYAVMMATPGDLEDFAAGFSLTEGLIESIEEIAELEIVEHEAGIELRMWLTPATGRSLSARRRRLAGPTGCGLCGVESLDAAAPQPKRVATGGKATPDDIRRAVAALMPAQTLNAATRAVHGAGFWTADGGLIVLREDVGRHNALDKLVGALSRASVDPAGGILVLTSRVSVEMVQKAASLGAPIVVAVSAPTALALRTAEAAGITLVAVARPDAFEVFTHPHRICATRKGDPLRPEIHIHAAC
jgi:FdhD protein